MFKHLLLVVVFLSPTQLISSPNSHLEERERLVTAITELEFLAEYLRKTQKIASKNKTVLLDYDGLVSDIDTIKKGIDAYLVTVDQIPASKD